LLQCQRDHAEREAVFTLKREREVVFTLALKFRFGR